MSILSIFRKKSDVEREERLRAAWEAAPVRATMRLARGNVNLCRGRFVTQEQIDARRKNAAEKLTKLKH